MMRPSISASNNLDDEEDKEIDFLSDLKLEMRNWVLIKMDAERLGQNEVAEALGYDPGALSRILNPDRHINSRTMFQIMHRMGREWRFSSVKHDATLDGDDCGIRISIIPLVPETLEQVTSDTTATPLGMADLAYSSIY
ncbi:hypothetical protein [Gluconobacter japonicus]|uniref:hypothetical protein n=1 Tax=Gluconobacter japonicus TaxID=376620 RepID=UPI001B8BB493|nr:hypothetical protein [Gluconobacter japonicus]MBS1050493.1 hypothetical protein [Gluconobacter japonicus]